MTVNTSNIADDRNIESHAETPQTDSFIANSVEIAFLNIPETADGEGFKAITVLMNGGCKYNYPLMNKPLSQAERKLLTDYEARLAIYWGDFCSIGMLLTNIKEFELYREKYATFDDYCNDKLGMHICKD